VTAENGYGIAMGRVSGFLLGKGGCVVTDLGALARPGVVRASVVFPDGTTHYATGFVAADPQIGLVAISLDDKVTDREGLKLASTLPVMEETTSLNIVRLGWRGAQDPMAVTGRLVGSDVSKLWGCAPPAGAPTLLAVKTSAFGGAAGGPVVDEEGVVLGVVLDVVGAKGVTSLVVPATAVRKSLLAMKPERRSLQELPQPAWPVPVYRLTGDPVQASQFSQAVQTLRNQGRCPKCRGRGEIRVDRVVGTQHTGNMDVPIVRSQLEECPLCHGEGVICNRALYGFFRRMSERGYRLVTAPGADAAVLTAAWKNVRGALDALNEVSGGFFDALVEEGRCDLSDEKASLPRGCVLYAQVLESLRRPDGRYVVLAPYQSDVRLLMRVEGGAAADGATPTANRPGGNAKPVAYGQWIIVAGVLDAKIEIGRESFLHLLPLDWVVGPYLGKAPEPSTVMTGALAKAWKTYEPEKKVEPATPNTVEEPGAEAPAEVEPEPVVEPEPEPEPEPVTPPEEETPKKPHRRGAPSFFGIEG